MKQRNDVTNEAKKIKSDNFPGRNSKRSNIAYNMKKNYHTVHQKNISHFGFTNIIFATVFL